MIMGQQDAQSPLLSSEPGDRPERNHWPRSGNRASKPKGDPLQSGLFDPSTPAADISSPHLFQPTESPQLTAFEATKRLQRVVTATQLLALGSVRGIGVQSLRFLVDHYGDLSKVWEDDVTQLEKVLQSAHLPDSRKLAQGIIEGRDSHLEIGDREREKLAARAVLVIGEDDSRFPKDLLSLSGHPYWLFVQGDPESLTQAPLVAVVGTRESTPAGVQAANRLTSVVLHAGLSVVSGLAEGIDAEAHRVTTMFEVPQVAVLGNGINVVFPVSTSWLRDRIVATGGAVVTEYLPNDHYDRNKFVQRNRIQAGLAAAVCPVEGKEKSGTAHTLHWAEEYKRPVFGVRRNGNGSDNAILELLTKHGHPVFDLSTTDGLEQLRSLLQSLPGSRRDTPSLSSSVLFQSVIRRLDDIDAVTPLTPDQISWLMSHIQQRYVSRETRGEAGNGG
jgi:DNA protecting protein DprA